MGYVPPSMRKNQLKNYSYSVKIIDDGKSYKNYEFNKYNLKSKVE